MPAETDYPTTTEAQPTTANDLDSIRASGAYRDLVDEALATMGRSDLSEADLDAAESVRDRAATVYDVRSVEEARALAEAATYVLNGGPEALDVHEENHGLTTSQVEAVERIKSAAEEAAVGLTPEAHGLRCADDEADDGVDRGDGLATDGGATREQYVIDGVDVTAWNHNKPERDAVRRARAAYVAERVDGDLVDEVEAGADGVDVWLRPEEVEDGSDHARLPIPDGLTVRDVWAFDGRTCVSVALDHEEEL
jgi:hypothetical protein